MPKLPFRFRVAAIAALVLTTQLHAAATDKKASPDGEWAQWLGPTHDAKSPDTGLLKAWPADGPKLLWKATIPGTGYGTPAIGGGRIYVSGDEPGKFNIYVYDLDGKPIGKIVHGQPYSKDHAGARNTVAINDGYVYVMGPTGLLICYDAKTLAPVWKHDMSEFGGSPGHWGYAESPLIYNNLCIIKPGGKNAIVALDKKTGKGVWSSTGFTAGPEYSSCLPISLPSGDEIVTGTNEGLIAVNAKSGVLAWGDKFAAHNTANCPTPAYSDGYVFWANGYGKGGVCMQLDDKGMAKEAWKTADMVCHHGGYVIDKGYIYGNNGDGWACLELKTGAVKWKEKAVGKGSLCWADGMLYLYGEKAGECALATCSPEGLKVTGHLKVDGSGTSWAHPIVIGGRLYLRYDTNLYCFDVKGL